MKKAHAFPVLTSGLISISFASIFIRWCEAPALIITFYRLALAGLFYLGVHKVGKKRVRLAAKSWSLAVLSGLFLAAHFALWISSLDYTSVASSVVLVQTAPVFVVVGSLIFLREKPSALMMGGVAVSLAGTLIISLSDFRAEESSLVGNLLAIGGAVAAAGYLLIGRKLRASVGTIQYVMVVYSIAAVAAFFLVLIYNHSFVNYSARTFGLFLVIAFVPQVIGHTSLNWALKYFSAASVSIATLAEPVGASVLALLFLGEALSPIKIAGGLTIICGVAIVLLGENKGSITN